MATYLSGQSGLLTAASTWRTAATGSGCQVGTPGPASAWITITASYVASPAFTITNGEQVDGVLVGLKLYAAGATGTVTIALFDGAVELTSGTVNVADIDPQDGTVNADWIFVPFGAAQTADGGNDYAIKWKADATNKAQILRYTGTANDITKILRTTTTPGAAPTTGDNLVVCGSGLGTSYTVTMDSTATTQYGWLLVTGKGTLAYGGPNAGDYCAAATNYVLRVNGWIGIGCNGTLTIGTVGHEVPRDSTAVLELVLASSGQYGIRHSGGTVTMQGLSRTSGKAVAWCRLTADMSVGATSASVDTDTGWKSGDEVVFVSTANTGSTTTGFDIKTLNADAGSGSLAWTGGTTYAHTGTGDKVGEVGLLTRNVIVRSTNSSYPAYFVSWGTGMTIDLDWVAFVDMMGGTANFGALDLDGNQASNTTVTAHYCTFRGGGNYAQVYARTGFAGSLTVDHCVLHYSGNNRGILVYGSTGAAITLTNNLVDAMSGTGIAAFCAATCATVENNVVAGCGYGFTWEGSASQWFSSFSHNTAHSITNVCFYIEAYTGNTPITMHAPTAWGSNSCALYNNSGGVKNLVVEDMLSFGHTTCSLNFYFSWVNCAFKNCTFRSDSLRSTPLGVRFYADRTYVNLTFDNCSFGSGTAHATADVGHSTAGSSNRCIFKDVVFRDCVFASASLIDANLMGQIEPGCAIGFQGNSAAPIHRLLRDTGWVTHETATYKTASPAEKLAPGGNQSSTHRHRSAVRRIKVAASDDRVLVVWVRKDASYAGSQPRLVELANPAVGIDAESVLDTMTGGADAWEELIGNLSHPTAAGVIEVCVECDGAAGAVYLDDWSFS